MAAPTNRGDFPGERWLPNTPDGATVSGLAAGDWATVGGSRYFQCKDATDGSATWVEGRLETRSRVFNFQELDADGANLTAVGASITVAGATSLYYGELNLDNFMLVTNINLLQGTTVGTDKARAHIYSSDGSHVAQCATAGVTTSGADTFLQLPLTSALTLPPGRYFVGAALDGTTDEIQVVAAGAPYGITEIEAGHAFAEDAVDITSVATTFTASAAPIVFLD